MTHPLQSQGLWTGCLVGSSGGCMTRFSSLKLAGSLWVLTWICGIVSALAMLCSWAQRESTLQPSVEAPSPFLVGGGAQGEDVPHWSSGKHAEDRTRRWEPSILPKSGVWEPGQSFMAIQANLTPKEQTSRDLIMTCCHSIHIWCFQYHQLCCSSSEIMLEKGPGKLYTLFKH